MLFRSKVRKALGGRALPEVKLAADAILQFDKECAAMGPITHVRFNLHPDGGVSRLRLWGERA